MEINITFRHSDPSPALKTHIQEKMDKLAKYFIKPTMAHITLNVEGARHHAEISISENHGYFTAQEMTHDMYISVDRAIEKIERQLKKYKEKIKNHHKRSLKETLSEKEREKEQMAY